MSHKRKCPKCGGSGNEMYPKIKRIPSYIRHAERMMGIELLEYKRCSWCQGRGFIE